jgi:pyridoxal 5'-phosphate synthase pdxT subunit
VETKPTVGVLALQGDVVEHLAALERAGAQATSVKTAGDLARVDGLVIPGGESTTVMKLLDRFGLAAPIVERARGGMPLWGTCMGMIVAAHDVTGLEQPTLDLIDITVRRNAFGRQNESAEVELPISALGPQPFPAIFIRAPWIERMGPGVELLASRHGHGVMVREGDVLGTAFHPELTHDPRVHAYFLQMVRDALTRAKPVGKASSAA